MTADAGNLATPRCYFCGKFVPPTKDNQDGLPASTLVNQATCEDCDMLDESIREAHMAEAEPFEYHAFEGTGTSCDVCDNDLADEVHQAFEETP